MNWHPNNRKGIKSGVKHIVPALQEMQKNLKNGGINECRDAEKKDVKQKEMYYDRNDENNFPSLELKLCKQPVKRYKVAKVKPSGTRKRNKMTTAAEMSVEVGQTD